MYAFENPSKAFETIQRAVKESGGWQIFQPEDGNKKWYYVILSGPYTGTYEMGARSLHWHPFFKFPSEYGTGPYRARVLEKIQPILTAVSAQVPAPETTSFAQICAGLHAEYRASKTKLSDFVEWKVKQLAATRPSSATAKKIAEAKKTGVAEEDLDFIRSDPAWAQRLLILGSATRLSAHATSAGGQRLTGFLKLGDPNRSTPRLGHYHRDDPDTLSVKIYILSQAAGLSSQEVAGMLRAEPRRLQVFLTNTVFIPNRAERRGRYARVLFRTWSPQQALMALAKDVEGQIPLTEESLTYIPPLRGFRGWKQAVRAQVGEAVQRIERSRKKVIADVLDLRREPRAPLVFSGRGFSDFRPSREEGEATLRKLIESAQDEQARFDQRLKDWREGGEQKVLSRWSDRYHAVTPYVSREQAQEMLRKGQSRQLDSLGDILRTLGQNTERPVPATRAVVWGLLAETVEGRRALEAFQTKDLKRLLSYEDLIVTLGEEAGDADPDAAAAFHAQAAGYPQMQGVRPLITYADFQAEKDAMGHCIRSYFWQTRSHCFSFTAPDGTRATLELAPKSLAKNATAAPGKKLVVRQFYGPKNQEPSLLTQTMLSHFLDLVSKQAWKITSERAQQTFRGRRAPNARRAQPNPPGFQGLALVSPAGEAHFMQADADGDFWSIHEDLARGILRGRGENPDRVAPGPNGAVDKLVREGWVRVTHKGVFYSGRLTPAQEDVLLKSFGDEILRSRANPFDYRIYLDTPADGFEIRSFVEWLEELRGRAVVERFFKALSERDS